MSGLPTLFKQRDSRLQPSGMTRGRGGFTLIELLVVVLIVGILTAVALPQYEKAVEQSRAAGGIVLARSIFLANQRYLMAHGRYTEDIRNLDLNFSGEDVNLDDIPSKKTGGFECRATGTGPGYGYTAVCRRIRRGKYSYYIGYRGAEDQAICLYNDAEDEQWCQLLTGKDSKPYYF